MEEYNRMLNGYCECLIIIYNKLRIDFDNPETAFVEFGTQMGITFNV